MKTPDEIKKSLEACGSDECHGHHTDCHYEDDLFCTMHICGDARAYIQQLENRIGELTKKVAQIKAEQQNLICDFMDYINDGVPNPAPYCAFGESCVLVDKRGWCRLGEHGCNGFVPKVRDDNENA